MPAPASLAAALADRYQLERELGQGGMATVYLARDLRHNRKVALKVLRPELSAILGGDRFLKEIELTAGLQHPHILPLHDSGEAGGLVYYVMPYVAGESLRDRLRREKQLPISDAVRIATEVASALDYAHRHGVIHRDIKPENILLHDGSALVADFGIALAASRAGDGTRMTETGMSLGTPHYMSPEQALGEREITARSDVYALGCVLYEMLTAEPPFTGATAQAIIARVMTEQPRSITLQRHTVPTHVEAAVAQALEKLPADRFATAAEFAAALANPSFGGGTTQATLVTPAARGRPSRRAPALLVPALGALTLVALALAAWALRRPAPPAPVQRFALDFLPGQAPRPEAMFALSPDGSRLVYEGPAGQRTQLWVKERGSWEAKPLAGTEGAYNFAISPDGEWVAFGQGRLLKKIPITGGAAVTVSDSVSGLPGLAWLDDGTIAYLRVGGRDIVRVPSTGGAKQVVWSDSVAQAFYLAPIPGGGGVIFTRCRAGCTGEGTLQVADFRTGAAREIQPGALRGMYLATGHLLFARSDGALFAVPFDPRRLETTGTPVPIGDNSVAVVDGIFPLFAVGDDGTFVYRTGTVGLLRAGWQMVWVDREGRQTAVDTSWTFRNVVFGANAGWSLSPDGRRLAIGLATEAGDNIWVKQLPTGPLVRATFDSSAEYRPRWMPDGRTLLFSSNRPQYGLYRRPADGTGADELVLSGEVHEGQVTRDGQWLVARGGGNVNQAGGRDIGALRIGVDTALAPLVATQYDESDIALSPDGRWLAYVSDETGRPEVFLRPFPNVSDAKYQVSTRGGVAPLWSRDGRELFYVTATREMTVVPVAARAGPAPALGEARTLFVLGEDIYLTSREYYTPFDISPDGRRFIMARRHVDPAQGAARLLMTLNWFGELERQLGSR